MCGITGVFEFGFTEPSVSQQLLKSMTDIIAHRGPDSDGHWISENKKCGLGFRRLSIIDLSTAGNQPMSTPNGEYTIVFNGEIYNYLALKEELISLGYKFRSKTDTETILFAYQEWGFDVVQKLHGMFAFALWDNKKKLLFCARDKVGKKPFYYYLNNGRFIFGSEIKSILKHPSVSIEFNENQLPLFLNYCMSGNRESLFKNINKLPSSHYLIINSSGETQLTGYWNPLANFKTYTDLSDKDIEKEIINLLRLSIKDRMMSDVPFGAFLSGGIDSSVNVALMAELMDRPVDTFTVGFKELQKYNELEYATKISKLFNTNHHEILIDDKDALPILEDLTWYEDEPNGDPVCIPLFFLSKLTRDSGTIVIQVGEGSDELFVGYPWLLREYLFLEGYHKLYNNLPDYLKKTVYNVIKPIFNSFGYYHQLDYIRRSSYNEEHYWAGMSVFTPVEQKFLLNRKYHELINETPKYVKSIYDELRNINPNADNLQKIFFIELNQRLSELLLMRVDKIGMAHSIEARVPFLDTRLIEFVMSIPPDKKAPDRKSTKIILKNAVKNIIPDEIINRKKQGFWAPVDEWLRNQWFDYSKDAILNSSFLSQGYLNRDYLKVMIEQHKSGQKNHGLKLFNILELCLWWNRFFN